jgi:hypothetical protein
VDVPTGLEEDDPMDIVLALIFFGVGLGLIIFFAEQLCGAARQGHGGMSLCFGISTFLLSVLFLGFDPDNIAVEVYEGTRGATQPPIPGQQSHWPCTR